MGGACSAAAAAYWYAPSSSGVSRDWLSRKDSVTKDRLIPLTIAANRSYVPAVNSRRISWKRCPPGNAQNRSIGARPSSRPLTVPAGSIGRDWFPARTS